VVFVVDGQDIEDVLPDEDIVGDAVEVAVGAVDLDFYPKLASVLWGPEYMVKGQSWPRRDRTDVGEEIFDLAETRLTVSERDRLEADTSVAFRAKVGKKLVPYLNQNAKDALILAGTEISVQSPLPFLYGVACPRDVLDDFEEGSTFEDLIQVCGEWGFPELGSERDLDYWTRR